MSALQKQVQQLADEYEAAEAAGLPIIELGKRLLAAREELQAATAVLTEPEPQSALDEWCQCQGSSGYGPCPKCGKRMFPF